MAKIKVLLADGREWEVFGANIIGDFAVHKSPGFTEGYNITFIPFKTVAASRYKDRNDAARIAWMLHSIDAGAFIRALYLVPVRARVFTSQQQVWNLIVNSGEGY